MEKFKMIIKNTIAIIVLLCLIIIVFYQNRDRDFMEFGKTEAEKKSEQLKERDGAVLGASHGGICVVGENVVCITPDSLVTIDHKGNRETEHIAITTPILHSESDYMLYYSEEYKEIKVYKGNREYYEIKPENRIIRAKVNKNGYTLVVSEKEGYSSEAIVYNRSGEAIFRWSLSKSEFLDGDINSDNNKIVLSAIDAEEKVMKGKIILIDITNAKVDKEEQFDSRIFYAIDFNRNGTYIATGSDSLAYFNASGTLKWEYEYSDRSLVKKDVSNPDVMVLAFSAAGSGVRGNSTEIEVINRLGKIVSKRKISSIADDVSVSGNNIAIAFGKKLYIMNEKLEDKKVLDAESSIKKMEFFPKGKHLFILGNSSEQIIDF